jgi:hypothetical protein
MRLLITHVTRMSEGFCCVAGLTQGEHRHVRPVLGERLSSNLLRPNGGPFDMGAIVDLGRVHHHPTPPEVEDHLFVASRLKHEGYVSGGRLWEILQQTASEDLFEIFGSELELRGHRGTVAQGKGIASLGCYRPLAGARLTLEEREHGLRIRVVLAAEGLNLSLTDARFMDDGHRPYESLVAETNTELQAGVDVVLGVGLTRLFSPDGEEAPRHWLQVNAVHTSSKAGLRLSG